MPGHIEAFDPVPEMGIASVAPPPERSVAPPPERMRDERAIERERDFQNFLSNTGRSDKDPYGDQGIFSGLAKRMGFSLDYTNAMTPAQINAVNRKAYQRFSNFGSIDPIAQGRRFGRPFGSSVGEMTAEGPVRKLIPTAPMSGAEMGARLGFSALGPLGPFAAFADRRGTKFAPLGSTEYAEATSSGDFFDPQETNYLNQGIFSQGLDLLTGGAGSSALSRSLEGVGSFFNREQESESDGATTMSSLPSFGREALEQRGVANTVEEGVVPVVSDGVKAVSEETGNTVTVIPGEGRQDSDVISRIKNDFVNNAPDQITNMPQSVVNQAFAPMSLNTFSTGVQGEGRPNTMLQSTLDKTQAQLEAEALQQQDETGMPMSLPGAFQQRDVIRDDAPGFETLVSNNPIMAAGPQNITNVTPPVPLSSYFGRITEDSFSNFGPNK